MNKVTTGLAVSAALFSAITMAGSSNGVRPAAVTGLLANHGQVLCTAAINSDASIAGGLDVASAAAEGTGSYQVLFGGACAGTITAANGFARFVQVDTLTTGSITDVSCTTADRSGAVNGVFVECVNSAGTPVNTSFFLFVTR